MNAGDPLIRGLEAIRDAVALRHAFDPCPYELIEAIEDVVNAALRGKMVDPIDVENLTTDDGEGSYENVEGDKRLEVFWENTPEIGSFKATIVHPDPGYWEPSPTVPWQHVVGRVSVDGAPWEHVKIPLDREFPTPLHRMIPRVVEVAGIKILATYDADGKLVCSHYNRALVVEDFGPESTWSPELRAVVDEAFPPRSTNRITVTAHRPLSDHVKISVTQEAPVRFGSGSPLVVGQITNDQRTQLIERWHGAWPEIKSFESCKATIVHPDPTVAVSLASGKFLDELSEYYGGPYRAEGEPCAAFRERVLLELRTRAPGRDTEPLPYPPLEGLPGIRFERTVGTPTIEAKIVPISPDRPCYRCDRLHGDHRPGGKASDCDGYVDGR